jgi:hypothetical protein
MLGDRKANGDALTPVTHDIVITFGLACALLDPMREKSSDNSPVSLRHWRHPGHKESFIPWHFQAGAPVPLGVFTALHRKFVGTLPPLITFLTTSSDNISVR